MSPSTGLKVCKPLTLTNGVTRVSAQVSLLSGSCATVKPGETRVVERLCQADGACFQSMGDCKLDTKHSDGVPGAREQRGPRLIALCPPWGSIRHSLAPNGAGKGEADQGA